MKAKKSFTGYYYEVSNEDLLLILRYDSWLRTRLPQSLCERLERLTSAHTVDYDAMFASRAIYYTLDFTDDTYPEHNTIERLITEYIEEAKINAKEHG